MGRYTADELRQLEPFRLSPDEVPIWRPEPIATPSFGHLLCYECDGRKRCDVCETDDRHAYCDGFCRFCGGAGQLPIHPDVPLCRPPPAVNPYPRPFQANLDYIRRQWLSGRD